PQILSMLLDQPDMRFNRVAVETLGPGNRLGAFGKRPGNVRGCPNRHAERLGSPSGCNLSGLNKTPGTQEGGGAGVYLHFLSLHTASESACRGVALGPFPAGICQIVARPPGQGHWVL